MIEILILLLLLFIILKSSCLNKENFDFKETVVQVGIYLRNTMKMIGNLLLLVFMKNKILKKI